MRRLADVVLGHAQLERRLRRLPLGRRVEVVGDDDVHPPVAVVVEKPRAHRKERVLEAGVLALLEGAVAAVPPDGVGADVGQVEVEPAVAVEIRPERAHPEPARADPRASASRPRSGRRPGCERGGRSPSCSACPSAGSSWSRRDPAGRRRRSRRTRSRRIIVAISLSRRRSVATCIAMPEDVVTSRNAPPGAAATQDAGDETAASEEKRSALHCRLRPSDARLPLTASRNSSGPPGRVRYSLDERPVRLGCPERRSPFP